MLVEFVEGERIYIDRSVCRFQETTGRTDILYNEMVQAADDRPVVFGQYAAVLGFAQRYRNKIESGIVFIIIGKGYGTKKRLFLFVKIRELFG